MRTWKYFPNFDTASVSDHHCMFAVQTYNMKTTNNSYDCMPSTNYVKITNNDYDCKQTVIMIVNERDCKQTKIMICERTVPLYDHRQHRAKNANTMVKHVAHDNVMEAFSSLLALCEKNPLAIGRHPSQDTGDVEISCFIWLLALTNCWTNSRVSMIWDATSLYCNATRVC